MRFVLITLATLGFASFAYADDHNIDMGSIFDNQLDKLVLRVGDDTIAEHPVTGMTLQFSRHDGDIETALAHPNEVGRDSSVWVFYTYFDIIAGGETYTEGGGNCSLWEDDISYCWIEDDGGRFLLTRILSDGLYDFTITLRSFPEVFEGDTRTAITIGYDGISEATVTLDIASGDTASFTFVNPARMQ